METERQIEIMHSYNLEASDNAFHFHDHYEVYIFLRGDVDIFVEQSCYPMQRGHLVVFNDKEIHRACYHGKEPYERRILHVSPKIVQSLSSDKSNLLQCFQNRKFGTNNAVLLSEEQLSEVMDITEKLKDVIKTSQYGDDILLNAYVSIFLTNVNKVFLENQSVIPKCSHGLIFDILVFIDSSLNADLSLETIAKHFSIDRYYLCHVFKTQTGTSLYQYILMKKISVARQYLAEGKSVTEACTLSGFNDYSNFIRTFKKVTGISPGKYTSR